MLAGQVLLYSMSAAVGDELPVITATLVMHPHENHVRLRMLTISDHAGGNQTLVISAFCQLCNEGKPESIIN